MKKGYFNYLPNSYHQLHLIGQAVNCHFSKQMDNTTCIYETELEFALFMQQFYDIPFVY